MVSFTTHSEENLTIFSINSLLLILHLLQDITTFVLFIKIIFGTILHLLHKK